MKYYQATKKLKDACLAAFSSGEKGENRENWQLALNTVEVQAARPSAIPQPCYFKKCLKVQSNFQAKEVSLQGKLPRGGSTTASEENLLRTSLPLSPQEEKRGTIHILLNLL